MVSASWSVNDASLDSVLSNLASRPKDALATICSLEAQQAALVLVIHGASLARVLPRETTGDVISLCVGTYAPKALTDASMAETLGEAAATATAAAMDLKKMVSTDENSKAVAIEPYPVYLFASAFVEQPKILRLLLANCNRNKCHLTPSLRRTLLELTLAECNQAKRSGDKGSCLRCVSLAFSPVKDLVSLAPTVRSKRGRRPYPYPWLWITWAPSWKSHGRRRRA
jgi:hypothetical protein